MNNLAPDVGARVNSLTGQHRFFVDIVNGNDLNDGKTAATALKTLSKLSANLSGKHHIYTHVTVAAGIYPVGLAIYDSTGNIYIAMDANTKIQGPSLAKSTGIYSPIYVANNATNITITGGEINGLSATDTEKKNTGSMVYCGNTSTLILSNVIIDGAAIKPFIAVSAINADGSKVNVRVSTIRNCGYPFISDAGGLVTSVSCSFSGNADGYVCQNGGLAMIKGATGTKPVKAGFANGYALNDIESGTIIETGTNVNGTYYKYSNGLLICTKPDHTFGATTIPVASGLFKTPVATWTYPATFSQPTVSISGTCHAGAGSNWLGLDNMAVTGTAFQGTLFSVTNSTYNNSVNLTAIGRWY